MSKITKKEALKLLNSLYDEIPTEPLKTYILNDELDSRYEDEVYHKLYNYITQSPQLSDTTGESLNCLKTPRESCESCYVVEHCEVKLPRRNGKTLEILANIDIQIRKEKFPILYMCKPKSAVIISQEEYKELTAQVNEIEELKRSNKELRHHLDEALSKLPHKVLNQ